MSRISLLGFNIDALTMDETIEEIDQLISTHKKCQHVVLNAGKVVLTQGNQTLTNIINNCELINADGQSIVWAAKYLGKKIPERVTGIDLMYRLFDLACQKSYKIFLFGAKNEVLERAVSVLKNQYPNLQIAGYRNGFFHENDIPTMIDEMNKSCADILFVGFSSPMKEYWLNENMSKLDIPFCMGVGGSIDVIAGKTKRAPKWMQKFGLEWFYRFIQEPRRMWRRYIIGNFKFLGIVIREKLKEKKGELYYEK